MESFIEHVALVKAKKMSVSKACEELGISRQTWYNRLKTKRSAGRPGRPRKHQPQESTVVHADAAAEQEDRERQAEWLSILSKANEAMAAFLNKTFPGLWCSLRFEHADAAGYWYTFELVNDARRQTWCIRHQEVKQ